MDLAGIINYFHMCSACHALLSRETPSKIQKRGGDEERRAEKRPERYHDISSWCVRKLELGMAAIRNAHLNDTPQGTIGPLLRVHQSLALDKLTSLGSS
jgi:hypothetical protein